MSLLEKIKKNSTIKDSAILSKSKFFTDKDFILNIRLHYTTIHRDVSNNLTITVI